MCTHLSRRGATYCFRRVVPSDLQAHFGIKEWMFSLRTKDRETGKRLAQAETMRTNALIDDARTPQSLPYDALDTGTAVYLSEKYRVALLGADDGVRYGNVPDPRTRKARRDWHEANEEGYQSARDGHETELAVDGFATEATQLAEADGLNVDPSSLEYRRLCSMLLKVRTEVAEEIVARDRGHGTVTPSLGAREARHVEQAPPSAPRSSLMQLFEAYVGHRQPSASTVRNWRPYIVSLIAHLGHDDAKRITASHLRTWRDKLLSGTNAKGRALAARTVSDGYLAAVKTVLAYGVDNEMIPANPSLGVRVRAAKKVKLRHGGFTEQEALTILRATLLPFPEDLSPDQAFARRWVPWLCAHTGARVNEISQLRTQDVKQEGGVWVIDITPEAGTVKTNEARTVPLHPQLVEMGFPGLVAAKGDGCLFYDPTRQRKPGDDSRQYKKVGERLAAWVRTIGVSDPHVQPNHGWRHLFKTTAREAGMDPGARDAMQGHAPRTQGEDYGHYSVRAKNREMKKMPHFAV